MQRLDGQTNKCGVHCQTPPPVPYHGCITKESHRAFISGTCGFHPSSASVIAATQPMCAPLFPNLAYESQGGSVWTPESSALDCDFQLSNHASARVWDASATMACVPVHFSASYLLGMVLAHTGEIASVSARFSRAELPLMFALSSGERSWGGGVRSRVEHQTSCVAICAPVVSWLDHTSMVLRTGHVFARRVKVRRRDFQRRYTAPVHTGIARRVRAVGLGSAVRMTG